MSEPVNSTISPWMPEQDRVRLAILGKLIEECNELAARAARCIIHGLDEVDPDSGSSNFIELGREVADVEACIGVAIGELSIPVSTQRTLDKQAGFERWHGMIREAADVS